MNGARPIGGELGDRFQATVDAVPFAFGQVRIRSLLYSSFLAQAEKRMFDLRKRLQEAPFLRDKGLVEFVSIPARPEVAPGLFDEPASRTT